MKKLFYFLVLSTSLGLYAAEYSLVMESPLHAAVLKGNVNKVQRLIEEGQNVDSKDKYGRTPLHYAAKENYCTIAQLLIQEGADVNVQHEGPDKETPLHLAVLNYHYDMVVLLLNMKADSTIKNAAGKTPLDVAREQTPLILVDFYHWQNKNKIVRFLEESSGGGATKVAK